MWESSALAIPSPVDLWFRGLTNSISWQNLSAGPALISTEQSYLKRLALNSQARFRKTLIRPAILLNLLCCLSPSSSSLPCPSYVPGNTEERRGRGTSLTATCPVLSSLRLRHSHQAAPSLVTGPQPPRLRRAALQLLASSSVPAIFLAESYKRSYLLIPFFSTMECVHA